MENGKRKMKTFDCVEMKCRAQQEIASEWERRRTEFASYEEFLEAGLRESEWGRRMLEKLRVGAAAH